MTELHIVVRRRHAEPTRFTSNVGADAALRPSKLALVEAVVDPEEMPAKRRR